MSRKKVLVVLVSVPGKIGLEKVPVPVLEKFWVSSHSDEDINLWPLSIRRLLFLQVGQVHCCATNPILLMITMRITMIMMAGYLKGECIAISCCVVICVSLEIIKNLHHI